mmetsp:Transcript_9853/g.14916  ORF Transcript_9853/g.14916 Transcript_9853/m.14916 type:complete len:180 (-) Transcript_9853:1524-2063(-)
MLCDLFTRGRDDNFLDANSFPQKESNSKMIALTYFAFTSLSTVGLGDYHPVADLERFLGSFILLFGVAITSFIMENLNNMIVQLNSIQKNFEENDKLSLFLGTMEKFNGDRPYTEARQQQILGYFEHRWQSNKNFAISTQEDVDLLVQLPQMVQNQIYSKFLFKDFIGIYRRKFNSILP